MEQAFTDEAREEAYGRLCAAIDKVREGEALARRTTDIVQLLLSSEQDEAYRGKTLGQVDNFFKVMDGNPAADQMLRDFAKKLIHMLLARVDVALNDLSRVDDPLCQWQEEDELLDRPTDVVVVPAPAPKERCEDFRGLLAEAIGVRVGAVSTFFQRHNPRLQRQALPLFVFSPDFGARLDHAIREVIVPTMMTSRPVSALAENRVWSAIPPADFWERLSADEANLLRTVWLKSWLNVVEEPLPLSHRSRQKAAAGPAGRPAAETPAGRLAKVLASRPGDRVPYAIPPLSADLGKLFASLLLELDRRTLEIQWTPLRQLYEQEMDRRIYQDRARYGAFRDRLLEILEQLPPRLGELMAVLCYYNFRRMSLTFLRDFVRNKGFNEAGWRVSMPLLMFFLDQEGMAEFEMEERLAEAQRLERTEERRRRRLAEEAAAMPENAVSWKV